MTSAGRPLAELLPLAPVRWALRFLWRRGDGCLHWIPMPCARPSTRPCRPGWDRGRRQPLGVLEPGTVIPLNRLIEPSQLLAGLVGASNPVRAFLLVCRAGDPHDDAMAAFGSLGVRRTGSRCQRSPSGRSCRSRQGTGRSRPTQRTPAEWGCPCWREALAGR